jgi:hypothetical protein
MLIHMMTKTSDVFRNVYVGGTVFLTHLAEETGEDGRSILHDLVLEPE